MIQSFVPLQLSKKSCLYSLIFKIPLPVHLLNSQNPVFIFHSFTEIVTKPLISTRPLPGDGDTVKKINTISTFPLLAKYLLKTGIPNDYSQSLPSWPLIKYFKILDSLFLWRKQLFPFIGIHVAIFFWFFYFSKPAVCLFLEPQFLTVFYYENIHSSVPIVSFSSKFPIRRAPVTTSLQMTLYFLTILSSDCFPDSIQCFLVCFCHHQQGTLTSPQSLGI